MGPDIPTSISCPESVEWDCGHSVVSLYVGFPFLIWVGFVHFDRFQEVEFGKCVLTQPPFPRLL